MPKSCALVETPAAVRPRQNPHLLGQNAVSGNVPRVALDLFRPLRVLRIPSFPQSHHFCEGGIVKRLCQGLALAAFLAAPAVSSFAQEERKTSQEQAVQAEVKSTEPLAERALSSSIFFSSSMSGRSKSRG